MTENSANQFPGDRVQNTIENRRAWHPGNRPQNSLPACAAEAHEIEFESLLHPLQNARPWGYWYFMDGHVTPEGMQADLDACPSTHSLADKAISTFADFPLPRH